MKNIVEVAAWVIVVKHLYPIVLGLGFLIVVIVGESMDKVTDRTYTGTKLNVRRK